MELIHQVLQGYNMMQALEQVKRNKGSAGEDSMPVKALSAYWSAHREALTSSILNGDRKSVV